MSKYQIWTLSLLIVGIIVIIISIVSTGKNKKTSTTTSTSTPPPPQEKKWAERGKATWEFFKPILKFALPAILVLWAGFVAYHYFSSKENNVLQTNGTVSKTATNLSYNDAPPDIAFPIIAKYESGGKQFEEDNNGNVLKDDDGNPIVLRGKNRHDIGYLQINEVIHADLIREHPELDIYKSKDDNIAMGKIIREKYHGYGPWYLTEDRWGPELAEKGFGEAQLTTLVPIEAPVEDFSEKIIIRPGFDVRWGESEDAFLIMNDRGLTAKYDRVNRIFEDLPAPSQWIKLKSLNEKIAIAKLRFSIIK